MKTRSILLLAGGLVVAGGLLYWGRGSGSAPPAPSQGTPLPAGAPAREEGHPGRKPLPTPEELAKLPPDGGPEYNRLVFEKSPYLLQHAGNPVDWHPWGEQAFEKARKEDKPVFLSVGYATCHWCHVMERESLGEGPGPPPTSSPEARPAVAGLHAPFDALLKSHVKDGVVDYKGLKAREAALDAYLAVLDKTDPASLKREERLALWINAYNAFTLKLILKHTPGIGSIKDIPDRWNLEDWSVGGKRVSLDHIEHRILRKMGDPRIHFAIVCASKSCPDLVSEAYVPERLDAQLSAATRRFLADTQKGFRSGMKKGLLGGKKPVVHVSKILDWFGEDFGKTEGDRLSWIRPYLPDKEQAFLKEHPDPVLEDLDYDWSLNGP